MARFGYHSYRGTSRGRKLAKTLFIVLVVLLLFAAAGYLYLQRYLVYSADGVYLDLPFLRTDEKPAPNGDGTDLPPVQVAQPEKPETPPPPERPDRIRAVLADPEALSEAGLSEPLRNRFAESGANTLILTMKAEGGSLGFFSQTELAVGAGVSQTDLAVNDAIRAAAKEPELWLVAKISCFRDNAIPKYKHKLSIMTGSGYRWYDTEYTGWMNPYSEEAQEYLIALAKELAELGFDEILLENCGFPVRGKVSYISYGANASTPFSDVIDDFLGRMEAALSEFPVAISVLTDAETVQNGKNPASGHTLALLTAKADRIYVPCKEEEIPALSAAVRQAAPDAADGFFVAVVPEVPDTASNWAIDRG